MISDTLINLDVSEYLYHMNYVLRNVFMSKTVGQLKHEVDLGKTLDRFRFQRVFDFSSSQLFSFDPHFSVNEPDSVVGFDIMRGDETVVQKSFDLINKARIGSIVLIPTIENHLQKPECFFSNEEWRGTLRQIGEVILLKSLDVGSIFVIIK